MINVKLEIRTVNIVYTMTTTTVQPKCVKPSVLTTLSLHIISTSRNYWVDAKVSADFFSFLCFKFLLKQNTINQQRIYHCYL